MCGGDLLISLINGINMRSFAGNTLYGISARGCDGEEFDRRAGILYPRDGSSTVPTDKIPAVSSTFIRNNAEKGAGIFAKPVV